MLRTFALLLALIGAVPALAQPVAFTASPLVCFEAGGSQVIFERMKERTQIGALGNPPSTDIIRNQSSCSYNSDTTLIAGNAVWMKTERWLVMLEIVDVGNDILMWRPADIQDRKEWRLPRGCPVFRTDADLSRLRARSFLLQNVPMPHRCLKPRLYRLN